MQDPALLGAAPEGLTSSLPQTSMTSSGRNNQIFEMTLTSDHSCEIIWPGVLSVMTALQCMIEVVGEIS